MSNASGDRPNPYESPSTASVLPVTGISLPLASRLSRLGAILIDGIIGFVISAPIMFFSGYFQRAMQNNVSLMEIALMSLLGMVIFLVIHGYLLATRGQTVGKMLAKVQIVDYHSNQLLPLGKLIGLRYLPVWIVSMIPLVNMLALVDALFIFGQDRRCLHDYIAGTKVLVAD